MQVPVLGYKSITGTPFAYATLDPECVADLESVAGEKLVLQFGKIGEVMVHIKYIEYLLETYRSGKRKHGALLNYIFGRMPFRRVAKKFIFLDGHVMNFLPSNLVLKIN